MRKKLYGYTVKMTESYPGDIRIFISRIVPILIEFYGYPVNFDKKALFNSFDWRNMYNRWEQKIVGNKKMPHLKIYRDVYGELQFTDEYERSTIQLINFCPPFIKDSVFLEIECSESFLTTDIGYHSAKVFLRTDSVLLYKAIVEAVGQILKQFKNAKLEVFRSGNVG